MQPARGLALIGALAVVAVATALGYEIIARHALSVSQSRQTLDGAQARVCDKFWVSGRQRFHAACLWRCSQ